MTGKLFHVMLVVMVAVLVAGGMAISADFTWAKGEIHDHTINSDGNGAPQQVADWYRTHGFQFLIITDHEKVTDPAPIDKGPAGQFVMIPGEELAANCGKLPVHANAFGISRTIKSPVAESTPAKTAVAMVDYIRKAGGIAHINHPSWYYALSHRDILQVQGTYLLEIANMSFGCNNEGDQAHLSMEQTWDYLLSNGRTVYATASDDMHNLTAKPEEDMGPGRGWIVARVSELTSKAVFAALSKGDFYASNGVELAGYSFDGKTFKIKVAALPDQRYLIRFLGKWGSILRETDGTSATYQTSGTHEPNSYIRCKVISGDGKVAWTQAFRIK